MSESKLWYLNQSRLFSELTPHEMQEIDRMTVMKEMLKLKPIYMPGDQADTIYLVKRGKVRISRISHEGDDFTLALLGPGDFFGELALLDDEARSDYAEAMEDTLLCLISKNDFETMLATKPKLHLKVTKLIGWRLRTFENRVENLIFKSIPERLQTLFEQLAEEFGVVHPEGTLIDFKLSHEEMGKLVNASRQTISENITRLKHGTKIRIVGKKVLLLPAFYH